jgi:hypothetical protein
MNITTRSDGANIVVELDGKQVAAYDYVECDLEHARMQAEAHAAGLRQGLEMAAKQDTAATTEDSRANSSDQPHQQLTLFTWDSEAVLNGPYSGTLAAMAPDEDSARDMIMKVARAQVEDGIRKFSLTQLEEDLDMPPVINCDQVFIEPIH